MISAQRAMLNGDEDTVRYSSLSLYTSRVNQIDHQSEEYGAYANEFDRESMVWIGYRVFELKRMTC